MIIQEHRARISLGLTSDAREIRLVVDSEVVYVAADVVPALCRALTEMAEKAMRLQAAAVPSPLDVDE